MKKKSQKPPNPKRRRINLPCRVNAEEMRHILAKATAHTRGNVSKFVRLACLEFKK